MGMQHIQKGGNLTEPSLVSPDSKSSSGTTSQKTQNLV